MKNKIISFLVVMVFITGTVFGANTIAKTQVKPVDVHFISTGNSDCILICDNGKYAMIDGADNDDEKVLVEYLNNLGIKELEYLILTHPDGDHCGGLDAIVKNFTIKKVLVGNGKAESKTYKDFVQSVIHKNLKPSVPLKDKTFSLGCGTFKFYNQEKVWNNANDNSLVVLYTIGSNKFLFMGDSGKEVEAKLPLKEIGKIDVLKVGHHGSNSSTSDTFMKNILPTYSVICCGENNKYGHPHKETLKTLNKYKVSTYRTDVGGTTIFTTDGHSLKVETKGKQNAEKVDKNSVVASDNIDSNRISLEIKNPPKDASGTDIVYITNSGSKYHCAGCRYLKKSSIEITVDEAKASGYSPCSVCNP